MFPAAIFSIIAGIVKGDILLGPFSNIVLYCSSIISIPPTPADTRTPTSSALVSSILKLASSSAIFVATKAN